MYATGKYRGRIKDYGVFQSETGSKNPQVFIEFELLGQYSPDGQLLDCPPGHRTYYKAITEKTRPWLFSDLRAVGYDKDALKYLDPEVPDAVNLFGREIDVDCRQREYEGSPREQWSIHRPRRKVNADELAKLDDAFTNQPKKVPANGKPATGTKTPNTTSDTKGEGQ